MAERPDNRPVSGHGLRSKGLRLWVRMRRAFIRPFSSSLTRRIAVLNLAGLLALFVAFLWLNQTRVGVIDARAQSLSLQAEIISAAIASAANADTGPLALDADKLLQQQLAEPAPPGPNAPPDNDDVLEFSINPARVAPILRRLVTPTRTRARVFDRDGNLLLDTKAFYSPGDYLGKTPRPADESTLTLFTRSWNAMKQRFGRIDLTQPEKSGDENLPEIGHALLGRAGNLVRVTADGQTIVFAATPIQRGKGGDPDAIKGALLLSTQEGDVDRVIAEERKAYLFVFLVAALVMLVLSVLLAGTIAEPMRRLSEAADRVRHGAQKRETIPEFPERSDEIGQLSRSLRDMTGALYSRIEAIERFAADVAHELKNPLTSLRSAVETLPLARNPESRERLNAVILHDIRRLDRLITDISDASRLDAELQRADATTFDLAQMLTTLTAMRNDVKADGAGAVSLSLPPGLRLPMRGHDSRLFQVFTNLVDNALSFSPPGHAVRISASREGARARVKVEDDGPGIPEHALERIFERFYTDRPEQGFGQNSGLGLSISKQIVEAHGGAIQAQNIPDGAGGRAGARFVVELPLVGA